MKKRKSINSSTGNRRSSSNQRLQTAPQANQSLGGRGAGGAFARRNTATPILADQISSNTPPPLLLAGRSMVSTTPMLLFLSSAGVRRAVGSFGPSVATAFLNAPTSTVMPMATRQQQQPLSRRFMSTDAPAAEEKTEEEKAAIKAEREARK